MNKKIKHHTLGCRLNQSETAVLMQSLSREGYREVEEKESADLCVINTCTVTSVSDSKCRTAIRRVIRENPEAKIAVVGCYAESGFKAISDIPGVDVVIGNAEKMNIARYIPEDKLEETRIIKGSIPRQDFEIDAVGQSTHRSRASLKVQDGCDFMCTFCIIPYVRGRSRSRSFQKFIRRS